MTDQIASITLRADVSDLKTASNELDKLGQAAAGAVDKADDKTVCFNEIKGMALNLRSKAVKGSRSSRTRSKGCWRISTR